MENGDLVYGNLTGALMAFLDCEPASLSSSLAAELDRITREGLVSTVLEDNSEQELFWAALEHAGFDPLK
jgi:hypothetical protein